MRIALVGDRSPGVRAHTRIPRLLDVVRERDGFALDPYWIPSTEATDLDGFDGIWVVPGSPYASEAGVVTAIRTARERRIPFLGTCGGFQHMLLEYARGVCGLDLGHAENEPGRQADLLLTPLECSLAGHEAAVRLTAGSRIERIVGGPVTVEAYNCAYGLNEGYRDLLAGHGLVFTGHGEDGAVRVAELPGHPFFLGTLFQPELAGDGTRAHPVITAFAAAVAGHTAARQGVGAGAGQG
jgi:CTP synthase (UTP-ammonia lyase)